MSQSPPSPALFDGDPAQYLRLRANHRDQAESKTSLSESEKNELLNDLHYWKSTKGY